MDCIDHGVAESWTRLRPLLSLCGSSSRGNGKETDVTDITEEKSAARGHLLDTELEVSDDFFSVFILVSVKKGSVLLRNLG